MVTLAKLALACGNMAEATLLASNAEALMENETWEFDNLVKVWRNLGRSDKANEAQAKANKILEEHEKSNKALQVGPFSSVNL